MKKEDKINVNKCQCDKCKSGKTHKSDCAVHNEPAERNGACNCS